MSERWRDTYDQWKLRSDRDDDDYWEQVEESRIFQCTHCNRWLREDDEVLDCYNPNCPMMRI